MTGQRLRYESEPAKDVDAEALAQELDASDHPSGHVYAGFVRWMDKDRRRFDVRHAEAMRELRRASLWLAAGALVSSAFVLAPIAWDVLRALTHR